MNDCELQHHEGFLVVPPLTILKGLLNQLNCFTGIRDKLLGEVFSYAFIARDPDVSRVLKVQEISDKLWLGRFR